MVHLLLRSYQKAFKEELLPSTKLFNSKRKQGEALFLIGNPVMAHNNAEDPCLSYANSAALQLWSRRWEDMIGMPSRLTTPKEEQAERNNALKQATQTHAVENYEGIRINSQGELFIIKNARIWTVWDENKHICGQAATFNYWRKI